MSVENPDGTENSEIVAKPLNGDQEQRLNGLSNGHIEENNKHKSSSSSKHKSSSKDKYNRDKDRDKDHKSSKSTSSSNRDKESDKHKSSSSSSKDKYRDKDKDKDKHKSSSSSHKSSTRDKDKEKDKDRDRDKEKDKEKSSRDKDRDKDKNKERSSDDKDKDRKKETKDKEKSSHSKDKESSSKDKDRDKDKDRHKSSSSSNKDKHSSSSTSKSKDKDRDRDKHSSKGKDRQREKDREREKRKEKERQSKNSEELKVENTQLENSIKSEEEQTERDVPTNDYDQTCSGFNDIKPVVKLEKLEMTNMRQNHAFNISQASSCDYSMSQFRSDEPAFIIKGEVTDDSQDPLKIEPENEIENDIDDEEDVPLAKRKAPVLEDSDDDVPLGSRKKPKVVKKEKKAKKKKREEIEELDDEEYDEKPKKKKVKKEKQSAKVNTTATIQQPSPTKGGRKKKEEEPEDVWRWWEEEKREDGVKWTFLEHKGPVFAPAYVPLPSNVHFYYDGKLMKLSQDTEEVACFYAKMLNHDYVTKQVFNDNFFKDWRKFMTSKEKEHIKDLRKCNFKEMHEYFNAQSEKNKNRTKDQKLALKTENEAMIQEYGFCIIDGHKERIGNFKIEPPGLFRGRGEHPKMGMVKRRVVPEEIHINCSKDSKIPQPPKGHRWKEVRHDNTVTWLASWTENIQGQVKYIMLNPSSKLKGEKDFQKYEIARRLDKIIDKIRSTYRDEWKSKEMRIRQRGVALYFIDKLALRAGNEKDEDQADTVGCCSLRVEHVQLKKSYNGMENVVIFDFLGKDSIRYYNEVEVEKRVFKNLELFMENKKDGDDLFDRLNTSVLNEHLRDIMDGLTAKVFRTYNASVTLQNQLDLLTDPNSSIPEKLLSYNRANRAVAVLCNHQRAVPKTHAKSMENLKEKIRQKRENLEDAESELHDLQKSAKRGSVKEKLNADKKKKQVDRLKEQLKKLELQETDRDENKTIALGTSKLNYLDPRISVAWCKKNNVPIDKIFNKTQRDKFRWAIHMATEDYRF